MGRRPCIICPPPCNLIKSASPTTMLHTNTFWQRSCQKYVGKNWLTDFNMCVYLCSTGGYKIMYHPKPLPCTCWRDDVVLLMQHKSPSDTTYAALVLSGAPLLICSCTLVFWCNWCMGASSTAHRHLLQRNPRFKWTWESGKNYPTLGARLFQRTLA